MCIVNYDRLNVVCMVFVGVENYLYFNQLLASLNLKDLSCICHETLEKVHIIYNFVMWESFLNSTRVLLWANKLETKEWSPVFKVNVRSIISGLQNSQRFMKFYSKQYWKDKRDKVTCLTCWLHEKVAFMSY